MKEPDRGVGTSAGMFGRLKSALWHIPVNGSTWAAYWSPTDPNGEIVYTADAYRGIDVLRIDNGGLTGKKVKAPRP